MGLTQDVNDFVSDHVPKELDNWLAGFDRPKIVHDALWGTFQLQRHEVAILDTPLLQRLRFLHQTGAVYLTYPSAHHTRFEHTLGVLCQSGRLCEALRRSDPDEQRISRDLENDVRCAALMHDTGHGPFSHTSEQFYESHPEIAEFRRLNPKLRWCGAGEILSYLIVQSSAWSAFIRAINSRFKVNLNADRIARLITGTTDADHLYMCEIVHGPFDADKLDYMPRDGMFSGLKMHVDVDRLYHSIKLITATIDGVEQTRIAGHFSGLTPFSQIMFNKMLLFTGMYHHHKVRAVDCMLWAVFLLAKEHGARFSNITLKAPASFLRITDDQLLMSELCDNKEIKRLITDIRNRRLWKRALVIARNTVPPTMHSDATDTEDALLSGVLTLAGNDAEKLKARRQIADEIWETAKPDCEKYEVWLDVPSPPKMSEAKKMWIDSPGVGTPRTLEDFIPIGQWVELYSAHQSRAHVFAPPHACQRVGEAAQKVLRNRFGLEFLPEARGFARSD